MPRRRRGGFFDTVSDTKSLMSIAYAFYAIDKAETDDARLEATASFLDTLAASTEGITDDLIAKHFRETMGLPRSRAMFLHLIETVLKQPPESEGSHEE